MSIFKQVNINNISCINPISNINQFDFELIYSLNLAGSWNIIPYIENGLYDRILDNFKLDVDISNWSRISLIKSPKTVLLQKPGKTVYTSEKLKYSKLINDFCNKNVYHGVVIMNLYLYSNYLDKNTQTFTFGDRNNVIKPFYELQHDWNLINLDRYFANFICKECEMHGSFDLRNDKKVIIPESFLNCQEFKVKELLI